MKRFLLLTIILILSEFNLLGQDIGKKPKLVVGILVDQMRFDYLYRYDSKYSEGGFKRLLREGFSYKNAHYNYAPTVTASGHASIYTGTTPANHGIIGNSWFDRDANLGIGNVDDEEVEIIGSAKKNEFGVSPKNLLTTTITDQLRVGSNFKSKVISISLKDRGAIFAGGHTPNGAYWHDWRSSPGYFITSSHYMDKLPDWVTSFNNLQKSNTYLDETWNTLLPIESYTESTPDDSPYEQTLRGKEGPVFPYEFKNLRKVYRGLKAEYQLLWLSPAGNSLITDFAKEAIKNEDLGKDNHPDLINISFSTPDAVGHAFGPNSVEIEDIYLRLDRNIEDLLNYLDENIGEGEYLVFLSADHAVVPVVSFLNDHKLPSGVAHVTTYKESLEKHLNEEFGKNFWIQNFDGEQVYLNRKLIAKKDLQLKEVQQTAADFLSGLDGISMVSTAYQLTQYEYTKGIKSMVQNGFHAGRSGDLTITFNPGFIQSYNPEITVSDMQGTTHGSGYAYDTHVPIIWWGSGISAGESVRKVSITDIAPSLAMFLNLQMPSGTTGVPLQELFEVKKK